MVWESTRPGAGPVISSSVLCTRLCYTTSYRTSYSGSGSGSFRFGSGSCPVGGYGLELI